MEAETGAEPSFVPLAVDMPLAALPAGLGSGDGTRAFEVRANAGTSGDGGDNGGTEFECAAVGDSGWSDTVPSEP